MAAGVVKVNIEIPMDTIAGLLASAFEGGSNYWYVIEKFKKPAGVPEAWDFLTDRQSSKQMGRSVEVFRHIDYPLNAGGSLVISDAKGADEGKVRRETLSLTSIVDGLKVMASDYPKHFADMLADNADATTGDVFLQCCLFGEAVYG